MPQWWDNYKETELSWTDWKQESKKLRTEGLNKEEIFKKIGVPTKDGQVIKVTSDGAGGYKPRTGQRAQQASRRATRIGTSKQEVNKSIRIEATKQWDELVGDRDTTIKIGNRNYTFDQYLNKEVRDHTKLTKQKAVEAVNLR
jgi:protein involved in polysaccharide export with SLBB domain